MMMVSSDFALFHFDEVNSFLLQEKYISSVIAGWAVGGTVHDLALIELMRHEVGEIEKLNTRLCFFQYLEKARRVEDYTDGTCFTYSSSNEDIYLFSKVVAILY